MKRPVFNIFFICLFLLMISCQKVSDRIYLHYLGHSAVYIDFDHDVSILCDYGEENAYLEWDWDSPIYDAGSPAPDIMTYSHFHKDHYDSLRAASYQTCRLYGKVDTLIAGIKITSFPSSEKDISAYDNDSFLFEKDGLRVLHLGDCQADIMMINDPAQAWNLEHRYPKGCDLLIMPIEGTRPYILQAIKMVQLLEPKALLPTHYWSQTYKQDFIKAIQSAYKENSQNIQILGKGSATFTYRINDRSSRLKLLDLQAGARKNEE